MGLIRLIIFALVIWMFLRLVKNFKARQKNKDKSQGEITNKEMVLCQYCSVHVPEKDAITHEEKWFCCKEHQEKFLADDQ